MSTPTIDTRADNAEITGTDAGITGTDAGITGTDAGITGTDAGITGADAEFDLDIRIFESGVGLDEVIRMTDDGCGSTCQSACNSC